MGLRRDAWSTASCKETALGIPESASTVKPGWGEPQTTSGTLIVVPTSKSPATSTTFGDDRGPAVVATEVSIGGYALKRRSRLAGHEVNKQSVSGVDADATDVVCTASLDEDVFGGSAGREDLRKGPDAVSVDSGFHLKKTCSIFSTILFQTCLPSPAQQTDL
jgi:hypothetical protein